MSAEKRAHEYIDALYGVPGYFDSYSGSVAVFVAISACVAMCFSALKTLQIKEEIAADWENQRCNPKYIPLAGFISRPPGKGIMEYTQENFQYCVQNKSAQSTGQLTQPLAQLTHGLGVFYNGLASALNNMRAFLASLRDNIRDFAQNVLGRIVNILIPFQVIFIALIDSLNKSQAVLTAGLYTMLGSYNTLQSLMGAILELIVKLLAILVVLIVGMWATPATWPAATATTAVFMAISIPLAIIAIVMTEVLHVHSPAIPKLRCFDQQTLFVVSTTAGRAKGANTVERPICHIQPGDWIQDPLRNTFVRVTATFKVKSDGLAMYSLPISASSSPSRSHIVVSGTHLVLYFGHWIRVSEHPHAIRIPMYNKAYVYCLNTTSTEIGIATYRFSDWDEVQLSPSHRNRPAIKGFSSADKIAPSCLSSIYGIVSIWNERTTEDDEQKTNQKTWHALSTTGQLLVQNAHGVQRQVADYNAEYDAI